MSFLATIEIDPAQPIWWMVAGLVLIAILVLILPFKIKWCEHNLEVFFLIMGVLAVTVSWSWRGELILEALKAPVMIGSLPIGIFQVVLVFGLLIYFFNKGFCRGVSWLVKKLSLKVFIFLLIFILGVISSLISVIVTSVILAEIVAALPLNKPERVKLVVVTCFAVGLGAVLTPLGEPMSTILVQRLSGAPYFAGFSWPVGHFAFYVIPAVAVLALFGSFWVAKKVMSKSGDQGDSSGIMEYSDTVRIVVMRAAKVFAFVAALVLLGEGLKPLIVWFFTKIPAAALYWINMLSSVLDNATMTAIEISPDMGLSQIICIVMGLLIAGGMLIPGNIPNIVAAGRLKISMKDWAKIGLPLGLVLMLIFFGILILNGHVF
jgi:predicted cation transporter